MNTLREAAQQALSIIDGMEQNHGRLWQVAASPEDLDAVCSALRAALAEPHDPVAYNGWVLREVLFDNGEPVGHREPAKAEPQGEPVTAWEEKYDMKEWEVIALRAGWLPARAPDPCPQCEKGGVCRTPECGRLNLPVDHHLRTAPQPAKRVPLTEEQILNVLGLVIGEDDEAGIWNSAIDAARAIEAAHGITGETK